MLTEKEADRVAELLAEGLTPNEVVVNFMDEFGYRLLPSQVVRIWKERKQEIEEKRKEEMEIVLAQSHPTVIMRRILEMAHVIDEKAKQGGGVRIVESASALYSLVFKLWMEINKMKSEEEQALQRIANQLDSMFKTDKLENAEKLGLFRRLEL